MRPENQTVVTEFILIGFSNFPHLQMVLFVVFSLMYIVTLAGNIIIMTIIRVDKSLHIPMYFFLAILSFSETCYTLVIVPSMLTNLLIEHKTISFMGCAIQMCFFLGFGGTNCILLAVMGYDCYVAICKPLHYHILMKQTFCTKMVAFSAITSFLFALIETSFIFKLPFCRANQIHHFFCDMAPVIKLACTRNYIVEIIIFIFCMLAIFLSFILILFSYMLIFNTILKIPSAEGKQKAFSTCASHLIVVVVHFGCASIVYLRPKSTYSLEKDTLISVTYTVVTLLLNPIVYSLRNKDV
ncbi:olfactory receptor 10R2-like [Alligator mississippiensis]|uniref:olfactory receptor 10R2-like n=1 Tax=Alligator mississippiensis TaxID=8496 RepID=UPI000711A4DF|nr:olfactory receptor 10R2-like [Alligator mississippiensis]